MKTATKSFRKWIAGLALALTLGPPVYGQTTVGIAGAGADLQVVRGDNEISPDSALEAGDTIRTGPSSFAELALGEGVRLFLGGNTSVTIAAADPFPTIQVEAGNARVATQTQPVRVQSVAGDFVLAELPAEVRFEVEPGGIGVQVLRGGILGDSLDTSAVIFRGPNDRPARVYQAGFTEGFKQTYPAYGWPPNVYVGVPGAPYIRVPQP